MAHFFTHAVLNYIGIKSRKYQGIWSLDSDWLNSLHRV